MCQAVVYLDDKETMRDVVRVEPLPQGVRLTTFFEPPRLVRAAIRSGFLTAALDKLGGAQSRDPVR